MRTAFALLLACSSVASSQQPTATFTRADTLRGSNGPARAWWDAEFYDLHVTINPADSSIRGWNEITYRVIKPLREMQIDLQVPMQIDSITADLRRLKFRRDSNAFFVALVDPQMPGTRRSVKVFYHGKPRAAKRPPWDGGFIWQHDSLGHRFIATANEGLGASVWWPNKDYLADEPDSQRIAITIPDSLVDVSNGRLRSVTLGPNGTTYEWFVSSPINNYNVAVNAARYAHFTDYYPGERGILTMDFYPLAIHEDTARVQFRQAIPMMRCFEHWFGPYPWYEDGYKLVEAPHLGMEHQSAIAYGNRFQNGYSRFDTATKTYRGSDASRTGYGLKWDFIIVHESAHEWWGNNLTDRDAADMWIHESFANYAEGLYVECQEGKTAGAEYIIGNRRGIQNKQPIIPMFGVNADVPGDQYPKGGNMLHTIRTIIDNDEKWRGILRGAQATFWHQTITGQQLRDYISKQAGIDLSKVFQQYLETTMIPTLETRVDAGKTWVRWTNVVAGFDMPVDIAPKGSTTWTRVKPTAAWMATTLPAGDVDVRKDFYVLTP